MRKLLALLALCAPLAAQTVNPNQIRPSGVNDQWLHTVTGGVPPIWDTLPSASSQLQQQLPGLPTNDYVILYPQQYSQNSFCGFNTVCSGAVGQSAYMEIDRNGVDSGGNHPQITESVTSLPAGVLDSTVTEVDQCYSVYATFSAGVVFPVIGNAAPFSQTTSCTVVHTGPGYDYSSASWYLQTQCSINCPGGGNPAGYAFSQPYLLVKLSVAAPTVNYINFQYPLTVNGNTISLQNAWPALWDTGIAANGYVASTFGITNLQQGQQINLNPLHTNTGASTFDFNGGGAGAIVKAGGAALAAGDMVSGRTAILTFNGDNTWLLNNPQTGSGTSPVTSVFTRTGAVTAQSGDYTVSQVTGAAPSASPTFTGTVTLPALNKFSSNPASGTCANGVGIDSGGNVITTPCGGSGGITQLTGDVTAGPGTGSQAATLSNTAVTAGSYTSANITVDAKGRITSAANGSSGGGGLCPSVNNQTGTTYTLVIGDGTTGGNACIGTITVSNAATQTVTVPPNSSVAFPVPDEIDFIQLGAGQTCIAAGAGVTLNTPTSLCARAQNSTFGIRKIATDTWQVFGDTQ